MIRALALASVFVGALVIVPAVQAEDKADPTGTWKWTSMFNNQTRESTLKLKLEDGKLTGSMPGRDNAETAIEDGKFEDGKVSFSITRERNGQKFTSKYSGTVSGDTIKGTIEMPGREGKSRTRDWEAKKAQ
jgi:hypothetical protein